MSDYYNIMGKSGERRVFTIPIGGLSKEEAEKQLKELIADYKSDLQMGADGKIFSKHEDYWIPVSDNLIADYKSDLQMGADGKIFSKHEDYWIPVSDNGNIVESKKEIIRNGVYTHPPQKIDIEIKKPWYKRLFS